MKNNNKLGILGAIGMAVFVFTVAVTPVSAQSFTQINSNGTLKVGSRGASVTAMQNLLASNQDIYPAGTVTGYFGSMTKNAVVQFQLYYDLVADGIAGSATRTKMNELISLGRGLDIYAPILSTPSVSVSGRNANITIGSNEPVVATAFYDTNNIQLHDSSLAFGAPTISGSTNVDYELENNKQFALSNLSGNANYNFAIMAKDASGNVSLSWPRMFTSGQ